MTFDRKIIRLTLSLDKMPNFGSSIIKTERDFRRLRFSFFSWM